MMTEPFYSDRFAKNVWLTNHAIEAMAKRKATLPELKDLMEYGDYRQNKAEHGWIYYEFPERDGNLVCAAVVNDDVILLAPKNTSIL